MVRPIPRKLLPDTVIYREFDEDSRYGEIFKEPVTLSFVRVEELTARQLSSLSDDVKHTHKLFYDAVTSESTGPFQFLPKSKVMYEGLELTIQKSISLKSFNTIHHWEVDLT